MIKRLDFFKQPVLEKDEFFEFIGRKMIVKVDRPKGTKHKGFVYPFNYGYVLGFLAKDNEGADVYILDDVSSTLVKEVHIIGVVYREDDVECKFVGVINEKNKNFSIKTITEKIHFQEKRYKSTVYKKTPN